MLCVGYHILNILLLLVTKARFKGKGVLTVVPLPKISGKYAKWSSSSI